MYLFIYKKKKTHSTQTTPGRIPATRQTYKRSLEKWRKWIEFAQLPLIGREISLRTFFFKPYVAALSQVSIRFISYTIKMIV